MTTLQNTLLALARNQHGGPHTSSWQALAEHASDPWATQNDGLTWQSWIPEDMAENWEEFPEELRIAIYILTTDVARWALDRTV